MDLQSPTLVHGRMDHPDRRASVEMRGPEVLRGTGDVEESTGTGETKDFLVFQNQSTPSLRLVRWYRRRL